MATLQYYYAELSTLRCQSRGSQNIKASEKKLLLPGPNNRIRKGGNNLRRRGTLYTTHIIHTRRRKTCLTSPYSAEERYKNRGRRRGPFFYFSLFLAASGQSVAKFYFHTAQNHPSQGTKMDVKICHG